MSSEKENCRRVIQLGSTVIDTEEWCNEEEAAQYLDLDAETLMNNVYKKKYPAEYVKQSIFSRRWWFWVPAIFGFKKEKSA